MAKMKSELIKVCPMCGHDVVERLTETYLFFLKRETGTFRCTKCSHTSPRFADVHPSNLEVYRESIMSNSISRGEPKDE